MRMDSFADDYESVRAALGDDLPMLAVGGFEADVRQFGQWPDFAKWLATVDIEYGWFQYRSRIRLTTCDSAGALLNAECRIDSQQSLHVRHIGPEGWTVTHFRDAGADCLCEDFRLLATRSPPGTLWYRRYWRPREDDVMDIAAIRFLGFAKRPD